MTPTPMPHHIEHKHLLLKSHDPSFAQSMFERVDYNREHLKYMPWITTTTSAKVVEEYILSTIKKHQNCEMFDYAIFTGPNHTQYLGNIGLHSMSWKNACGEIGYWLDRDFSGQGHMSVAVEALETAAFKHGFQRLEIRMSEENINSGRVALRGHYRLEATLRSHVWERSAYRNTLVYAKLVSDFTRTLPAPFIRRAHYGDAQAIHQVHMRSINEVCGKDYTTEQLKAWGGRSYNESRRLENIEKHAVWVVDTHAKIQGVSMLVLCEKEKNTAEVELFYFAPELLGKGMGRALMLEMKAFARNQSITKIRLNSTKTALPFYHKMGFKQLASCPQPFMIGDVSIDCHPMECSLV